MQKHLFALHSPLEVGDEVMLNGNDGEVFTVQDILAVHSARYADVHVLYDIGVTTVTFDCIRGRLVDGKLVPIGGEHTRCEKVK